MMQAKQQWYAIAQAGSEAIVMPAVSIQSTDLFLDHDCDLAGGCECGCRTIPDSAYPLQVLHQDDDGLVYLLVDDTVVIGQSIDFDYQTEGEGEN